MGYVSLECVVYIVTVEAEIGKEKPKDGDFWVKVYDLWGN